MVDVVEGDIDRPFEGTCSRQTGTLPVVTQRFNSLRGVYLLVIWATEKMVPLSSLGLQSMRL